MWSIRAKDAEMYVAFFCWNVVDHTDCLSQILEEGKAFELGMLSIDFFASLSSLPLL